MYAVAVGDVQLAQECRWSCVSVSAAPRLQVLAEYVYRAIVVVYACVYVAPSPDACVVVIRVVWVS